MATGLEVSLLPADGSADAEIDAFLEACPSSFAQQTPSWRDVILAVGADQPVWLGCRREGALVGVVPAYRFAGPLGAILTSVPQAGPLGGIACGDPRLREAVYEVLVEAFLEYARTRDCDLATVIGNPFWPDAELYERFMRPDWVLDNALLALDLHEDVDASGAYRCGSTSLRRNLRRARNGALSIDAEQSCSNVEEWYEIHATRHLEIGATPLPARLFESALEFMVPRNRARFFFVRVAETGAMASGGLYLRHGEVTDAFMPSMDSRYADLRPNYLLADHSIDWARASGSRYYNWQGSPPGSGVERFKRQWGSQERTYGFYTRVTGDATRFLEADVSVLAREYRWHYALPFDQLGAGAEPHTRSSRTDVWNALEEQP
jgi:hypothetical protein